MFDESDPLSFPSELRYPHELVLSILLLVLLLATAATEFAK